MHRTFELYGHRQNDHGRFEVVTCHQEEVLRHAHALLDEPDIVEVDVREGGRHLFTLTK